MILFNDLSCRTFPFIYHNTFDPVKLITIIITNLLRSY